MESLPLVSIGLPVYNGEECLREALESLVTQSYRNIDIVISDNASTDRTPEICHEFAARDPRVQYHRNVSNIGVIANFRHVLALATGEFFMWACADDIRPPNAVETLVTALVKNRQAVMVHGPIILKIGERKVGVSNEMDLLHASAAKRVRIFTAKLQHNGMEYGLYRRAEFEKVVYADHYGTDYLTSLQMCLLGPIEYVRVPILEYDHKEDVPTDNPMYRDLPVTIRNIVRPQGRQARKCQQVLVKGCSYLMRSPATSLRDRISATLVYTWTFCWRFRAKLTRELVGMLFSFILWPPLAIRKRIREHLSVLIGPRHWRF